MCDMESENLIENHLKLLLSVLFEEAKLDSKENEFRNIAASFDRVNLVYNCINKLKTFKDVISATQDRKLNKESDKQRICGNDYFIHKKKYLSAIESYTKSIAFAVNGSSYLALAYANRSACLFEGKYYKECLEDIDRALSLNYPENLKPKLLRRKAAAESQKYKTTQKQVRFFSNPPVIKSKNPLIDCAEDSIEIQYNQKYGRHIVATRDIKIGEVLSVENSFCHAINPESKYIHCHECLELCFTMIPCENCSSALYCSEECKSKSYEEYHKYECQFPKFLISSKMMFIKLALLGMDDSKKVEADLPDNIYVSDSFKEILKLETNKENRNFFNICIPAIAASIAYHVLKENQEFTSKYHTDEDDHNLKKLLYESFMVIGFNPFNIKKPRYIKNEYTSTTMKVATALYTFTSLFNHSCVPNCEFFHYGSWIVTRAQEPIKKGEQVTICYGIFFSNTPRANRKEMLKKNYLFDCDCKACTHNWPIKMNLPLGKQLPQSFMLKLSLFNNYELNRKSEEEFLTECKRLYFQLKKYEPCQNLLVVQETLAELYKAQQVSRNEEFFI